MKIVIVGGHLAPALGVIDSLSSEDSVVFIGRKHALEGDKSLSLEYQEITKRNLPFHTLTAGRLQRTFSIQTLPSLSRMPVGVFQALKYLRGVKPDVVLAFGGYLSVPVGFAAKLLSVPLVIHEQTLEAGLANKLVARFATKICISWENSRSFFPTEKVVLTGNPLKQFKSTNYQLPFSKADEKLPLLYVTGGSTGSHVINQLIEDSIGELTKSFRVIHQTGSSEEFNDFERLTTFRESMPRENKDRYDIHKYISSMHIGTIMKSVSIVLSRSGINTISELIFFGKPALLIPLPHGQKGEQLKNARFLEQLGLARVLLQQNATSKIVSSTLLSMLTELETYQSAVGKAQATLQADAAQKIIDTLSYVVKKKSS